MNKQTTLFDLPEEDEPHKHKKFLWKQITNEPNTFACNSGLVVSIYSASRHVIGVGWVHKFYIKLPTEAKAKEFSKRETVEQYLRTH